MMAGRNFNRKFIRRMLQIAALGGVLGLVIWIYLASRIDYPAVVRFGDGSPQGRYAMLNAALYPRLARALEEKFGSRLEIVHTQGSLENLRKVESGELHLGFCQEGVGRSEKVRSVINLEYEYLYWVVKDRPGISSLADLQGKRINLGPRESGTYILSRQILDYYPLVDYEERNYAFEETIDRFDGELDAAFFVAASQAPVLSKLLQKGSYRILPIPFVAAMRQTHSWIAAQTIPAMAFLRTPKAIPPHGISTLAVKTSIIAGEEVAAPIVETTVRTILESPFAQENNLLFLRNKEETGFAHGGTQFHLHEGARAYYFPWQPTIPSDFVESWSGITGLLVLVFSGLYTAITHLRQRHEKQRVNRELAKKNALDDYIQQTEAICDRVIQATTIEELQGLRRELNFINLQASVDYREEKFRSSEDFTAFTAQVSFVLAQIVAKTQEIRA